MFADGALIYIIGTDINDIQTLQLELNNVQD